MKLLTVQKKLAGSVLKCSTKRIKLDPARINEVKEAITRADVKALINSGAITRVPARSPSKVRARKHAEQKRKGRRRGQGSRKGTANARLSQKRDWVNRVRLQRQLLKELRDKAIITPKTYQTIYQKSKGGFFRSKRHVKVYLEENKLTK